MPKDETLTKDPLVPARLDPDLFSDMAAIIEKAGREAVELLRDEGLDLRRRDALKLAESLEASLEHRATRTTLPDLAEEFES